MSIVLILVRKSLANFVRDKVALALVFAVPIALIYIFGQVFGINRKDAGPVGIRLAVVNASREPAAQKLVTALQGEKAFRVVTTQPASAAKGAAAVPLTENDVRAQMIKGDLRYAVVIPADVIRDDTLGVRLKILSNPRNEIEAQTVNGLLQKTIFANVPELLGQALQARARKVIGGAATDRFNGALASTIAGAFGGDRTEIQRKIAAGDFGWGSASPAPADPSAGPGKKSSALGALGDIVKLETEQVVGRDVKSPEATRVVGGWALMFLLFALSGSAATFFEEKQTGIFQRLLSGPVSHAHLLWSRFLWGVLLGLVQLTALFLAGHLMYGIDVFGHFGLLVLVSVAAAAACTAFGMLLVAFTSTPSAANGLATFLVLTMSACGGAWFPISFMPEFMQQLAKFTLVYWAMEGFSQVLWAGHSLVQLLPTLGVLVGIAGGVMAVAVWRFNRSGLFE